ncbi:MAG TPA: hypothetical protein PKD55_17575 [Bellilinea sp.]|nr:hypothetical protein [Bellilinea sp.]
MEPKPTYNLDETVDAETTAQAIDLLLATMTPIQLLALAEECSRVSRRGFGRVVAEWRDGRPTLLLTEQSKHWR